MDELDQIVASGNMAVRKVKGREVLIKLLTALLDPDQDVPEDIFGEKAGRDDLPNVLILTNGSMFMVNAGPLSWCLPMPVPDSCARGAECPIHRSVDYPGPYTHVEVWAIDGGPTPWGDGDSPTSWATYAHTVNDVTMFRRVPVELVRRLVLDSGGIREAARSPHPGLMHELHDVLPSRTELQSCS